MSPHSPVHIIFLGQDMLENLLYTSGPREPRWQESSCHMEYALSLSSCLEFLPLMCNFAVWFPASCTCIHKTSANYTALNSCYAHIYIYIYAHTSSLSSSYTSPYTIFPPNCGCCKFGVDLRAVTTRRVVAILRVLTCVWLCNAWGGVHDLELVLWLAQHYTPFC